MISKSKTKKSNLDRLRAGSLYLATPGMEHKEAILTETLVILEHLPPSPQVLKAVVSSGQQELVEKTQSLFGHQVWEKYTPYTETLFDALDTSQLSEKQKRIIFKTGTLKHTSNSHATLRLMSKTVLSEHSNFVDILLDVMAHQPEIFLDGVLQTDLIYHPRMRACASQIANHLSSFDLSALDPSSQSSFKTTDRGRLILLKMAWVQLPYALRFDKHKNQTITSAHHLLSFSAKLPDIDILLSQTKEEEAQLIEKIINPKS